MNKQSFSQGAYILVEYMENNVFLLMSTKNKNKAAGMRNIGKGPEGLNYLFKDMQIFT